MFGCDKLTFSKLGWPVWGSKKAKVLTSNLLTWEREVVWPWSSTGTELLMLSKGLGHLSMGDTVSCSVTCPHNFNTSSRVASLIDSTLPVIEKRPHRVSRCRVCKAIPYAQGKCGVRGRLGDGNLHVCSFAQGQGERKLVLRKEGCERCIWRNNYSQTVRFCSWGNARPTLEWFHTALHCITFGYSHLHSDGPQCNHRRWVGHCVQGPQVCCTL